MMKPSAILVNTSRGAVVDEQALVESLRSGKLFGAGLDVFEKEPPDPNNPLFDLENVIVSPHTAALTEECFRSAAVYVAREVLKTLKELPTLP